MDHILSSQKAEDKPCVESLKELLENIKKEALDSQPSSLCDKPPRISVNKNLILETYLKSSLEVRAKARNIKFEINENTNVG